MQIWITIRRPLCSSHLVTGSQYLPCNQLGRKILEAGRKPFKSILRLLLLLKELDGNLQATREFVRVLCGKKVSVS